MVYATVDVEEEEKKEIIKRWNDGVTKISVLTEEFHRSSAVIVRTLLEMGADYEYVSLSEIAYEMKRHNVKEVVRKYKPEVSTFWKNQKGEYIPLYDYTDLFVDRPCICKVPEWKLEWQRKGIINFGY